MPGDTYEVKICVITRITMRMGTILKIRITLF